MKVLTSGNKNFFSLFFIVVVLMMEGACGSSVEKHELHELIRNKWMLRSPALDNEVRKLVVEQCSSNSDAAKCIVQLGFDSCVVEKGDVACNYRVDVNIKHDKEAQVEAKKESLQVVVTLRAPVGALSEASILVDRSGSSFVFE